MRLLAILVAIAGAALLVDAKAGGDVSRWCAEQSAGAEQCGFSTQRRCLQVVQRSGGTCRPEVSARAELSPGAELRPASAAGAALAEARTD